MDLLSVFIRLIITYGPVNFIENVFLDILKMQTVPFSVTTSVASYF